MGKCMIAALVAGVGLVAATARAEGVASRTVFAAHVLRAQAVTSLTASCPAGFAAVSAGVATPGRGTTLLSARPLGLRTYVFRFGNPTASVSRTAVAVACRTTRPGQSLRVRPVVRSLRVAPGRTQTAALVCPAQTVPGGSSVDLAPGRRGAGAFGRAALALRSSTAGVRGFRFTLRNTGGGTRRAVAYGTCVTVLRQAPSVGPLRVRITTFTEGAKPGRQLVAHRCPASWSSLGTGYAVASGGVRVTGAAAVGATGRWWVENDRAATTRVRLQLVCGQV